MIDAASINPATNIRVLLAHGQGDSVLPFEDSKRLNEMLVRKRVATNWNPFDGGHTITTEILDATRDQLNQTDR
jgi:phospholipase/carboxylesterase